MDYDTVKQIEDHIRAWDGVSRFDISLVDDSIPAVEINMVEIYPMARGNGIGTAVMNTITQWADDNGVLLTLAVEHYDMTGNRHKRGDARLRRWYQSYGFVRNTGRHARYELWAEMYRTPETEE